MMEIDWKDGGAGVDGDYGCCEAAAEVGVDKRRRMMEVGLQSTWVIAQAPELALKLDVVEEKGLQILRRQVMNDSRWVPKLQLWRHLAAADRTSQ